MKVQTAYETLLIRSQREAVIFRVLFWAATACLTCSATLFHVM